MVKKSNNKKQASLAEKTEQILLTMPRIIATQIAKDLEVQKQQEAKLKTELTKLEFQQKKFNLKLASLKKQNTAASKKQAKTTQKLLQKTLQLIQAQTRQLQALQKQFQQLSQKKAKYVALQAQLNQFQKDWSKKMSKMTSSVVKVKAKAKKKTVAKKMPSNKAMLKNSTYFAQEPRVLEIIDVPVQDSEELSREPVEAVS